MRTTTRQFLAGLSFIALFASCSRPVAYFQPTAREHFAAAPAQVKAVSAAVTIPVEVAVTTPIEATVAVTPVQQLTQATKALDQVDALVRNDSKLAADKTVQKRLNRVRTMLAKTSTESTVTANTSVKAKKMNLMQRFMLKKMNKKISHQLAPANPEKAMAVKGILALGAVILIAGLLLVLLTTGTGATIGVIGIIGGLALLLIGLI